MSGPGLCWWGVGVDFCPFLSPNCSQLQMMWNHYAQSVPLCLEGEPCGLGLHPTWCPQLPVGLHPRLLSPVPSGSTPSPGAPSAQWVYALTWCPQSPVQWWARSELSAIASYFPLYHFIGDFSGVYACLGRRLMQVFLHQNGRSHPQRQLCLSPKRIACHLVIDIYPWNDGQVHPHEETASFLFREYPCGALFKFTQSHKCTLNAY